MPAVCRAEAASDESTNWPVRRPGRCGLSTARKKLEKTAVALPIGHERGRHGGFRHRCPRYWRDEAARAARLYNSDSAGPSGRHSPDRRCTHSCRCMPARTAPAPRGTARIRSSFPNSWLRSRSAAGPPAALGILPALVAPPQSPPRARSRTLARAFLTLRRRSYARQQRMMG